MDVSAEAADLVVKESLQATESAAKLLGSGVKNVAALLLAIAKDNYKVVGKTNSKRLARDPAPAEVIRIKKEDRRTAPCRSPGPPPQWRCAGPPGPPRRR